VGGAWLGAWLAAGAIAKGDEEAQPAADEPAVEAPAPELPGMAGHFHRGALLMLAVAVNDRTGARDLAKQMATDKAAPSPLREAAKRVVPRVGNPERAGPAVAELGWACAQCHLAGSRGPVPHDTAEVPGADPTERHIMAAMFTWIGLVTPVEQPYVLGLEELVPPVFLESDDRLRALADRLRDAADQAREAESWAQRTEQFGQVLATCAACHREAGVRP
jgi:hypothetical protein